MKSMYGMNNTGNLYFDELTNFLIYESSFLHSECQMSIYYNYAPDGSKLVVLYYFDDYLYCYTSE